MRLFNLLLAVWDFVTTYKWVVLFFLAAVYAAFWVGSWDGRNQSDLKPVLNGIQGNLEVKEKQDEIRNHRVDVDGVIMRMRNGSF